jgi:curli biogenesis system outer membrane secretion channel CsgG
MRKLLRAWLTLALVAAGHSHVGAQVKVRIAIWDFDNNAGQQWWFSNDLGPATRNQIERFFSGNSTLSSAFTVIEREKLSLVMKEQGLSTTGAIDSQTAAKVGRLLGVKYILTGAVDKFSINTTKGTISKLGLGGTVAQAEATITMRVIDIETGERILSIAADGQVRKGGGFLGGTSLSREAEWGIASETIEQAAQAIVEKLAGGNYLTKVTTSAGSTAGIDARIVKTDGTRAYINLGASAGVKVGDTFAIFHVGEELVDPVTGAKLGAEEKQTGTGTVVSVQEKFAVMNVTGTASVKDIIRKQP